MSALNVIRTWIDDALRNSPRKDQRTTLLETPAQAVELNEADLDAVAGASFTWDDKVRSP